MKELIITGVTFEEHERWDINLNRNDIVTPIWKRGKIIYVLITRRKTGEALYIGANTREINVDTEVNIIYTPHGTTYVMRNDVYISVLNTWVGIYKR